MKIDNKIHEECAIFGVSTLKEKAAGITYNGLLTLQHRGQGPGLAIRIMGEVTQDKREVLRRADHIMCEEIGRLRVKPQQYFAVYTGAHSVGGKGDDSTYDEVYFCNRWSYLGTR